MEKKLMLPANYNVMNEEEMTYTSGGDGFTAPFAVGWTIGAVISVANLIWGLDQTRTWIKNNKKNGENITDLAAKGINAAADYMGKSIGNAIVGVYTALNLTGLVARYRDRLGHGLIVLTRQPGELQRTTQGGGSPQAGGPPPFLFTDCFWKNPVVWVY